MTKYLRSYELAEHDGAVSVTAPAERHGRILSIWFTGDPMHLVTGLCIGARSLFEGCPIPAGVLGQMDFYKGEFVEQGSIVRLEFSVLRFRPPLLGGVLIDHAEHAGIVRGRERMQLRAGGK
jgi:hypothetical protein